ncbi:polyhomeotic-like protein 2 [Dermacentor silvarum]|uniref:polyhomeotic-like protein 2 n=1 Tax=Dermacentor silvarum TaxID=543639 RepID=UPI001899C306|nr:polyhomeotic-like protein 2 [Dermacentor silvarum]
MEQFITKPKPSYIRNNNLRAPPRDSDSIFGKLFILVVSAVNPTAAGLTSTKKEENVSIVLDCVLLRKGRAMPSHQYNTRNANRHETPTTVSVRTRETTRSRRPRRRCGPRFFTRSMLERWVAAMPRVTPWSQPELVDHVAELSPQPGVTTHVVAGHVVQESSEAFSIGVNQQGSRESAQATPDVRLGLAVSPRVSLAVPNLPFDSPNDALAVVDHAAHRDAAAALAAAGKSSFEHELAPSEALPPLILVPCVLSPKHDPAPTVVCTCKRQLAAPRDGDTMPNISSSPTTASDAGPALNVSPNSASEARDCGDVLEKVAASAPSTAAAPDRRNDSDKLLEPSALPVEDLRSWTVDDVVDYVCGIPGCQKFAGVFREQDVDGEALLLLDLRHLHAIMNLPLGPALKILDAIRSLRSNLAQ